MKKTLVIPKETLHDYDTGNNTCKSCDDVCYFQAQYTQNKVFVTLRAAYYTSLKDIYYDGTSDEWLALLSTGTLILYNSNSAIVHFSKY